VAALRDALHEGLSISSAVSRAREGLSTDSHSLAGALMSFERDRADVAIEAALSLRSLERSVMEVLLPTLDGIAARHGTESAAWAFAAGWGAEWLQRARRLAPSPVRPASIVIGDASRDALDPDAAHIRALELFCLRAGIKVLSLSARGVVGVGEAASLHHPDVIVSPAATWTMTPSPAGRMASGWRWERCHWPSIAAPTSARRCAPPEPPYCPPAPTRPSTACWS